jgi:hypothetical protein
MEDELFNMSNLNQTHFEINTMEGYAEFTTNGIKGFLEAVIIKTDNQVEVNIESELGYRILSIRGIGVMYIPLRTRQMNEDGHGYNEGAKFLLNEKLKLMVNGGKNIPVTIILKLS